MILKVIDKGKFQNLYTVKCMFISRKKPPIAFELSEKKAMKPNNAKLTSLKNKLLQWFVIDPDLEAHMVNIIFLKCIL